MALRTKISSLSGAVAPHGSLLHRPSRAGFTLVEVMVAAVLLVLLSVAMLGAVNFAARMARLNSNAIVAKNIAQGYFERMAIDNFTNVGPTNYPDIDYDSATPVWLDQALNIRCRIRFKFMGFGTLTNASADNLTDNNIHWEANEWAGDVVYLVDGPGKGQSAVIDFNTPNTLHLQGSLAEAPHNGTKYMINNGKTVTITTTWKYLGQEYSRTIESLVIKYRKNDGLGF